MLFHILLVLGKISISIGFNVETENRGRTTLHAQQRCGEPFFIRIRFVFIGRYFRFCFERILSEYVVVAIHRERFSGL